MSAGQRPIKTRTAKGQLKWFDREKGFGFIVLDDRSGDAFLHISLLKEQDLGSVDTGDLIDCEVYNGEKGIMVQEVSRIERLPATSRPSVEDKVPGPEVQGRIKFYDRKRGYGFVEQHEGGDVYFTTKVLEKTGLRWIEADQEVKVKTLKGKRGLLADSMQVVGLAG